VHELIAWGLDDYSHRDSVIVVRAEEFAGQVDRAQQRLAERECYTSCPALLEEETESIGRLLAEVSQRKELKQEYERLEWTLGVVDLRRVLAFQRRLVFSPARHPSLIPPQDDWPQLISLALGLRRETEYHFVHSRHPTSDFDISLLSSNPDLQLRLNPKEERSDVSPFRLYGGSPCFEVAEFRGRWFLRDGYHRAYRLLCAGVHRIPAVVIYARTIGELGANEPWFFSEDQLFSDRPPRVVDFLDESLVLRYERTALRKIIRIRIEESLEPFDETEELQGEEI
jgi:hypothetical protein